MKVASFFLLLFFVVNSHGNFTSLFPDPGPRVLQIVEIVNGTLVLDRRNLQSILDKIQDDDTEVAVLSIAGEFRKGKSFLLNYMQQYLENRTICPAATVTPQEQLAMLIDEKQHGWLRDIDRSKGFHFKGGLERDTTGIRMYSEPFIIKKSNNKSIAILIMDSQGLYDSSTDSNDNVRLFSLASLLSSTLMLNTAGNINSEELLQLKSYTDYAVTGSQLINGTKPFQRLTFLIRDYTLEPTLGWEGGSEVLSQFMDTSAKRSEEMLSVTRNLTATFSHIDCFALPPPGKYVIKKTYNGSLEQIDLDFLHYLEQFVIDIIETIEPRKPLVVPLTASTAASHFDHVIDTLNKQMSPSDLMLVKERSLVIETFKIMEKCISKYEERIQEPLILQNDSYYLSRSIEQIMDDVTAWNDELTESLLLSFDEEPVAHSIFELGANKTGLTAMQSLRQRLETRFNQTRPSIHVLNEKRIEEAVQRQKIQVALEEERKRNMTARMSAITDERTKMEKYIVCANERERRKREWSFWRMISDFFTGIVESLLGKKEQKQSSIQCD